MCNLSLCFQFLHYFNDRSRGTNLMVSFPQDFFILFSFSHSSISVLYKLVDLFIDSFNNSTSPTFREYECKLQKIQIEISLMIPIHIVSRTDVLGSQPPTVPELMFFYPKNDMLLIKVDHFRWSGIIWLKYCIKPFCMLIRINVIHTLMWGSLTHPFFFFFFAPITCALNLLKCIDTLPMYKKIRE